MEGEDGAAHRLFHDPARAAAVAAARAGSQLGAALVLALFTLAAAVFFHNFWAMPAEQVMMQKISFFKNVGIVGGLLAFAAIELWPHTLATASDIDAVCLDVVADNCAANAVPMGARPGELTMLVADGMDHPLLQARGPYDLIIANILAGPLIGLAPDFARHLVPGGHLVLAGLLETQEAQVRRAARNAGLRLAKRLVNGDWSILWLRKRGGAGVRASRPGQLPDWAKRW